MTVAQQVEQVADIRRVDGSTPSCPHVKVSLSKTVNPKLLPVVRSVCCVVPLIYQHTLKNPEGRSKTLVVVLKVFPESPKTSLTIRMKRIFHMPNDKDF